MSENTETVFYVGDDPDGVYLTLPTGETAAFDSGGDGVKVPAQLAKELLSRDEFQSTKPTRSTTKKEND